LTIALTDLFRTVRSVIDDCARACLDDTRTVEAIITAFQAKGMNERAAQFHGFGIWCWLKHHREGHER